MIVMSLMKIWATMSIIHRIVIVSVELLDYAIVLSLEFCYIFQRYVDSYANIVTMNSLAGKSSLLT